MKTNSFLVAAMLLLTAACNKTYPPNESGSTPDLHYFTPAGITVRYVNSKGKVEEITVYKPAFNSDSTTYTLDLLDTIIQNNGLLFASKQRLAVSFDKRTHSINNVQSTCQYLRKFMIGQDSSLHLYSTSYDLGNFKADISYVTAPGSIFPEYENVQLSSFDDSLFQKNPILVGKWAWSFPERAGVGPYYLTCDNRNRIDKYWVNNGTIFLRDQNYTASLFWPKRHQLDLMLLDKYVPEYQTRNEYQQYFFIRSPFVCDSSKFQTGVFLGQPYATVESSADWVPNDELKITYSYSTDSSALSVLAAAVNPGFLDPNWYYIAYYGNALGSSNHLVMDMADTYNITAVASTDSAFLIKNGQKQLKWAGQRLKNSVFKDAGGRITRMVNYSRDWAGGDASYKEIIVSY